MDYKVVWTNSARADLKQLVEYISEDNPAAAESFGLAIIEKIESVGDFPRIGRIVPEENKEFLRELPYSPYRLIYEVHDDSRVVFIVRIWHSYRGSPEAD
jgi:addiction module RelE/StbE family toxin